MQFILDILNGKWDADKAINKAAIAEAEAKVKSLDNLSRLTQMMSEMTAPVDVQKNVADPSKMPAAGATYQPNMDLATITTQERPTITGNRLMDELLKAEVGQGKTENVAKFLDPMADAKRKMMEGLAGAGAAAGQAAPGGGIGQLITAAAQGDVNAINQLSQYKALGMDFAPFVDIARKGLTEFRERRKVYDPTSRQTYEATFDKRTNEEIPGSRQLVQGEDIKTAEESLPGGAKRLVGISGRNIVPLGSAPPALGPTPKSGAVPFDITLPGATDATATKIGQTLGGIITQQGANQDPLQASDLSKWIHPDTGKHPTKRMSPDQMEAAGYVPYEKLDATAAGKFSDILTATESIKKIRSLIYDKNGRIIPSVIASMKVPVPGSVGEKVNQLADQLTIAMLHLKTGAAATKEEQDIEKSITGFNKLASPDKLEQGLALQESTALRFASEIDPSGIHRKLQSNEQKKPSLKMPQPQQPGGKKIIRTGTYQGRRVVMYEDGSIEHGK